MHTTSPCACSFDFLSYQSSISVDHKDGSAGIVQSTRSGSMCLGEVDQKQLQQRKRKRASELIDLSLHVQSSVTKGSHHALTSCNAASDEDGIGSTMHGLLTPGAFLPCVLFLCSKQCIMQCIGFLLCVTSLASLVRSVARLTDGQTLIVHIDGVEKHLSRRQSVS